LNEDRSPGRKLGTIDNRGSHYYLAQYWAQELANHEDAELAAAFAPVADALTLNEATIVAELIDVQGQSVDIGGYFHPNAVLVAKAMRPSATLNGIISSL